MSGVYPPMRQEAPDPGELRDLVSKLTYKQGWSFYLSDEDRGQDCAGLTLNILVSTRNSYDSERFVNIRHLMPVPPAAYNRLSWRRWLLEQVLLVERHEACEFFVVDGEHPYAPHHGPGNDVYTIFEHGTE